MALSHAIDRGAFKVGRERPGRGLYFFSDELQSTVIIRACLEPSLVRQAGLLQSAWARFLKSLPLCRSTD